MSAFIVGKEHVDALVATAVFGPSGVEVRPDKSWYGVHDPDTRETLRHDDADRIGMELWNENLRSIHYRYPDTVDTEDQYPGPLSFRAEHVTAYEFPVMTRPLTAVQAIKAAHCLDYQSCEHPEWEASWSCRFLANLREALETRIDGYDEADWEITAVRS